MSRTTSTLPLIAMGAVAALIVIVGLALGLRGPESFADGTPEAALQHHLNALIDGDEETFLATLASNRVDACRSQLTKRNYGFGLSGTGFELDDMTIDDDQAVAAITQRYADGGDPFDGGRRSVERTVDLTRESNGEWKVSDASWPSWLMSCLAVSQ